MASGEKLYKAACIACHEADGMGAPRIYPPLPGNTNLQSSDPASALRIILDGAETITTPRAPNKGIDAGIRKEAMSDQEIVDVTTYIRNAWGNAAPAVTPEEVAKSRKIGPRWWSLQFWHSQTWLSRMGSECWTRSTICDPR